MTVEDRVRDLLARDGDTIADIPGWNDIEARIRNRPRHGRRLLAAAAAVIAVIAIATAIAVWPNDDSVDVIAGSAPRSFIGATRDEITERSTTDGTVQRTILRAEPNQDFVHVALSPDRTTVYVGVERPTGWCDGEQILAVPRTGGPARIVASGAAPSISPDGARLAFVRHGWRTFGGQRQCRVTDLVVRDLDTGHERSWSAFAYDPELPTDNRGEITFPPSWSADSRRLIYATTDQQVWILDTRTDAETIYDAHQVPLNDRPAPPSPEASILPTFDPRTNDLLIAPFGLVRVDPHNGRLKQHLLDGLVVPLAFDPAGQFLLFIRRATDPTKGYTLHVWDGSHESPIGNGPIDFSATW